MARLPTCGVWCSSANRVKVVATRAESLTSAERCCCCLVRTWWHCFLETPTQPSLLHVFLAASCSRGRRVLHLRQASESRLDLHVLTFIRFPSAKKGRSLPGCCLLFVSSMISATYLRTSCLLSFSRLSFWPRSSTPGDHFLLLSHTAHLKQLAHQSLEHEAVIFRVSSLSKAEG